MGNIIYDARKIKVYERLIELAEYTNKNQDYISKLWEGLLIDETLMKEFMYYLDNHTLLDQIKIEGYSLTDLYVWNIGLYNLYQDLGKNPIYCNKEAMVLDSFMAMIDLKNNPEELKKRLSEDLGMDKF